MMAGAAALGLYAGLLSTVGFAADIKRGGTTPLRALTKP